MTYETILIYITTSIILAITPGPDNIFVMIQTLQHGIRSGLAIVLGLCTGLIFHTLLVALGLAALLIAHNSLLLLVKSLGVMYLLYLAYKSWIAHTNDQNYTKFKKMKFKALYIRGIIMNITNPKVTLFFLAFLPQFVSTSSSTITQDIIFLGFLFMLITLFVFGGVAFLSGTVGNRFKKNLKYQRILNKISSLIFVTIALYLIVEEISL